MLQCEAMERKSRDIIHHKKSVFQKERSLDRRFSGFRVDTPQPGQGMYIKYRASERAVKPVIQMNIANAQAFRGIAYHIANDPYANYARRTVGVSNNMFAISPQLRGSLQQNTAQIRSGNRQYAGPVPNGNQIGNHAERKLIFYDGGLREIGVTRPICPACEHAICNNAARIEHVSDPNGTYAVFANGLQQVAG